MTTLTPALTFALAIIALCTGLASLFVQLRKAKPEADKAKAEAEDSAATAESKTVATALSLLPALRQRIDDLEARINDLEARDRAKTIRIDELEDGVKVLTAQVVELGHRPAWPPPSRNTIHREGD